MPCLQGSRLVELSILSPSETRLTMIGSEAGANPTMSVDEKETLLAIDEAVWFDGFVCFVVHSWSFPQRLTQSF